MKPETFWTRHACTKNCMCFYLNHGVCVCRIVHTWLTGKLSTVIRTDLWQVLHHTTQTRLCSTVRGAYCMNALHSIGFCTRTPASIGPLVGCLHSAAMAHGAARPAMCEYAGTCSADRRGPPITPMRCWRLAIDWNTECVAAAGNSQCTAVWSVSFSVRHSLYKAHYTIPPHEDHHAPCPAVR